MVTYFGGHYALGRESVPDMSRSGVIQVRMTSREKHYWLKQDCWRQVLNRGEQPTPKW